MSKLIRRYSTNQYDLQLARVSVFRTSYSRQWDYIQSLVSVLKADFPEIQDSEISLVVYGGDKYKRMVGVEADVPTKAIPNGYKFAQLESTL